LVNDNLEDIRLFEEAFAELEDVLFSRSWLQACALFQAESISEALGLLGRERVDVVVVDLTLSDGSGLHAFRRIRETFSSVPVIVLTTADEEDRAIGLVRQGAQDYVVKSELDCIPLARSLRCAIERQRLRSAESSALLTDDLTGLFSEAGLQKLARLHGGLATKLGQLRRLYVFDLDGLDELRDTCGAQERDMAVILASDVLRQVFSETDVVARIRPHRFAVLSLEDSNPAAISAEIDGRIAETNARRGDERRLSLRGAAAVGSPAADLEALLDSALESLCENRRSRQAAGM
jgi:PleD family two-component response regulator